MKKFFALAVAGLMAVGCGPAATTPTSAPVSHDGGMHGGPGASHAQDPGEPNPANPVTPADPAAPTDPATPAPADGAAPAGEPAGGNP